MPASTHHRPVWRRFDARFLDRAVAWVKAGGAAAVVHPAPRAASRASARGPRTREKDDAHRRIDLLLGLDEKGNITEQGYWAVLALEQRRWLRVHRGKAKGLGIATVQPHAVEAVVDWCERDSIHPGPTRRLRLDCLDCGACCHESNVILYDEDLARFRAAGRQDLTTSTWIKRSGGKITLRMSPTGRCHNLLGDLKCRIYPIRPHNCRVFPMASEACLAARESTLGLRDGAPELPPGAHPDGRSWLPGPSSAHPSGRA